MRRLLHGLFAIALVVAAVDSANAQSVEPIRYTLRFPAPHTHYVEVEAVYPTGRRPQVELMMAVWTPGSYLVREYERNVEDLAAKAPDGHALAVMKPAKNRWRIETGGAATVTVTYRVYGREMTVRNNWVESAFAMLNGAPTFITLADRTPRAHEVRLELPASWKAAATPLMPMAGQVNAYRAEDFDTLVDSPIIAGNPVIKTFEVDGKRHHLVLEGDPSLFDADRAAADVKKIVETAKGVMGVFDYPHYYFLNMVVESGGGLEHKNAFLTMSNRFTTRTRRSYVNWLSLVGHEYFHNWNVKRLRPIELGPFDYETENYTKSLWVAEGFTDYYGALLVKRAGLSTPAEYLDMLSDSIEAVQTRPGRHVQPVEMASFDTWIKQYRPDENSANTSIDYYDKGATIAFVLDAKIRKATSGAKTLDDAMRLAYQRYSGARGYTPEQFQQVMSEVASDGSGSLVRHDRRHHRGDRLRGSARLVRPALHAGRSKDAPSHDWRRGSHRRRPPGRDASAAGDPGVRRGRQRGRRDPGHRRHPCACGRPDRSDGPVPRGRHGAAARRTPGKTAHARRDARGRARPPVAAAGEARRHRGAEGPSLGLARSVARHSGSTEISGAKPQPRGGS